MKNYVVIGGSSGIGEALVEKLAVGNNVFASYNENEKQHNGNTTYFHFNTAEEAEVSNLPEVIHGIAYCPGTISLRPFARIKGEQFIKDYEVNVVGAVKIIQQLLPNLKKAEGAAIVLFSTVAVQTGMNFHSLVASSKGAIEGLTRALAAELAPAIRVNCIAPSLTDTPLASALLSTEEKKEASANRHPLKKVGTPNGLAQLAQFLISEQSDWITGQIIHADGGMSSIRPL